MTTFARIVDGIALDCQHADSEIQLSARFHPEWLATHPFIIVPDGTCHGARANGDGSYTNPIMVPQVLDDLVISRSDFVDHSIAQLGGNARFGAIIVAAKTATDAVVGAAYEKYSSVSSVTKTQAQQFFMAIRQASLPAGAVVTPTEIAAIVNNWPKG